MEIKQAGAITYKVENEQIKVLLVRAKKNPHHWLFPKGHIEKGETEKQAAHRELLEEAGIRGGMIGYVGERKFKKNEKPYSVSYFLFCFEEKVTNGEEGRTPTWYSIDDALNTISFSEMKDLIHKAVAKVPEQKP
ncbi:NUDIX domain-containing protein [Chitinispirillales bacterium ANBcel5]|uniref:NUDIX domain-containing protein n=1 Tax=Cellulosispirillum alkaliphilum TaxID=3039283 RepID=UPI002A592A8D|nr:NUDIX domain-containing protein [Chitinispirillales bacterium ANBcel5]